MKILVTNDDGIDAPGLWALASELAGVGEVVVFAPTCEQSGIGTGITLHRSVGLRAVDPAVPGVTAYAVDGTPGDSVLLGLEVVKDAVLVFSGINRGANMGHDVLLSGTVGAALQGYLHGLPSVAVSVAAGREARYEVAARLASVLARKISGNGSEHILLNVNLPNLPLEEIAGIELTRVGRGGYSSALMMGPDGSPDKYRISIGQLVWNPETGTDLHAVDSGKISITPLRGELGAAEKLPMPLELLSLLLEEM
jgi:5'-nucleotidase